ncbi:unnamed protein product [Rotaria sp. Silwood1]|nr:unnamed protein product [Rotaria sp. Silwood1]
MSSTTRIFSFGLGHSPSRSLVKGLARATNGHFIFIPPSSRVDTYVGTQIQRALQPSFVNCRLQWFGLWPSGSQAPRTIPPVYSNERVLVYTLFDNFIFTEQSAMVNFTTDNGRIGMGSLNRIEVRKGNTIRRLAAKALMQELQHRGSEEHVYDGRIVKQRIIDLSLTHQILSPYTAFVGVETTRSNTSTPAPVRYVPIQISTDGEHLPSQNRYPTTQSPQFIPPMEARVPPIVSPSIYDYQERMPQALVSGYTGAKGRPRVAENRSNEDITRSYQGFMEEINANTPVLQSTTQSSSVSTSTMFDSTTYDNKPSTVADLRKPSAAADSIRWLIEKQSFNGAWILSDDQVQQLTGGKSWTYFISTINQDKDIITTALAIALLESQHVKQKSLWFMIAEKGRRRLLDFGLSKNEIDLIINEIQSKL